MLENYVSIFFYKGEKPFSVSHLIIILATDSHCTFYEADYVLEAL